MTVISNLASTLPQLAPVNGDVSSIYANVFNAAAAELEVPVRLGNGSLQDTVECISHLRKVADHVESDRLRLVRESFGYHHRISYRAPLEHLARAERQAVQIFWDQVFPIINRIEARQQRYDACFLSAWMASGSADPFSRRIFERFRHTTLAGLPYATNPVGSLVPWFPDAPVLNGMIDPNITAAEFSAAMVGLPPNHPLLRPTTYVDKNGDGSLEATPLPLHPNFVDDHRALAEVLYRIASLDLDPCLKEQMNKWAMFFTTGNLTHEMAAVQATIDAGEGGGNLRLHIGPSESYWEDGIKYPYLLQLGVRDRKLAAELDPEREAFLELESGLTDIPHYTPRPLSLKGGYADTMWQVMSGGFMASFPYGEPAGNNFPNFAYPGVQGSNRFILLDAARASTFLLHRSMGHLLSAELFGNRTEDDVFRDRVRSIASHEAGHLVGPLRGHICPNGQPMGSVFGAHWGDADEPKADLTIMAHAKLMRECGIITNEDARARYVTLLGVSVSMYRRGKAAFFAGQLSNHHYGHFLGLGYRWKRREIIAKNVDDGLRVHVPDMDLFEQSGIDLRRQIIAYQAAGDLDGFRTFANEQVAAIPDEVDAWLLEQNRNTRPVLVERYLGYNDVA